MSGPSRLCCMGAAAMGTSKCTCSRAAVDQDEALRVAKKLGWPPPYDAEERERRIKALESALHEVCDELLHFAPKEFVARFRKVAMGGQ
jgi:hypothetical protein